MSNSKVTENTYNAEHYEQDNAEKIHREIIIGVIRRVIATWEHKALVAGQEIEDE